MHTEPAGVVIEDSGAPLTGSCSPSGSGSRVCNGRYDRVHVELGDGIDRLDMRELGGSVEWGPGDDEIVVAGTSGVLRRDVPRHATLSGYRDRDLDALFWAFNTTPRKCLAFQTPLEAFALQLSVALET